MFLESHISKNYDKSDLRIYCGKKVIVLSYQRCWAFYLACLGFRKIHSFLLTIQIILLMR